MSIINFKNKNEYSCNQRKNAALAHKIMLFYRNTNCGY